MNRTALSKRAVFDSGPVRMREVRGERGRQAPDSSPTRSASASSADIPSSHSRSADSLPAALRRDMEHRFNWDFSRVRVHQDASAARTAQARDAAAYTIGQDIVFGFGTYAPHSRDGQRLIAHELAHVVQQDSPDKPRATAAQAESEADAAERSFGAGRSARVVFSRPVGAACKPKASSKAPNQATGILVLKDMKKVAVDLMNGDQYVYTLQWCSLPGGTYRGSMRDGELVIENAENDTVLQFGDSALDAAPDPGTLNFSSGFPVAVMTAFLDPAAVMASTAILSGVDDPGSIMQGALGPRPGEEPRLPGEPRVVTLTPEEAVTRCESGFLPGSMVFPFQPAGGVFTFDIAPIMAWRDGDRIAVRMPAAVRGTRAFVADVATLPVDVFTVNGYRLDPNELVRVRFYGETGKPTKCVTGEGMLALAEASDNITGVSIAATSLDALMLSPVNEIFAAGARTLVARAMLGTAEAVPQFGGRLAPQAIIRAAEEEAVSKAGAEFAKQWMTVALEKRAASNVVAAVAEESAEKAAFEALKKTAATEAAKAAEAGVETGLQQAAVSAALRGAGVAGVELSATAVAGEVSKSTANGGASTVPIPTGVSAIGDLKGISLPQPPAVPKAGAKAQPVANSPELLFVYLRNARIDPNLPAPPMVGTGKLTDHSIYRDGIVSPVQAYQFYNEALQKEAFGREVAIYRDKTNGMYLVFVGSKTEIEGLSTWQQVLHFHPNPSNVPALRRPSGVDVLNSARDAFTSPSGKFSEFVETYVDGVGRVRTEFGVDLGQREFPFFIDDPLSELGVGVERYKDEFAYLNFYVDELAKDTLNFMPGTPEYNEVMTVFKNYADMLEKRDLLRAKP